MNDRVPRMGDYQYAELPAIDRPLARPGQAALWAIAARARIAATSITGARHGSLWE